MEQLEAIAEGIGEPDQPGHLAGRQIFATRGLHLHAMRSQTGRHSFQGRGVRDLPAQIRCAATGMHQHTVHLRVDAQRQAGMHRLHLHGQDTTRKFLPCPQILGEHPQVAQRLDVHVALLFSVKQNRNKGRPARNERDTRRA